MINRRTSGRQEVHFTHDGGGCGFSPTGDVAEVFSQVTHIIVNVTFGWCMMGDLDQNFDNIFPEE